MLTTEQFLILLVKHICRSHILKLITATALQCKGLCCVSEAIQVALQACVIREVVLA